MLRVPIEGEMHDFIKDIYKICKSGFDGYLIRRPKVSLILDDIGSEK